MNPNDLKRVLEALIFAADAPLTPERIRETLEACTDEELAQTVETLNGEYEAAGHSFMIRHVAGGYQVTTRPEYSNWIRKLYLGRQKGRLSQAALESLAIIAFKQPISRVDIAQIRGVNSDAVIGTLLERKLVTISGRSEAIGRPLLYSTTSEFLEFFGINDLAELPKPREIEELIGKEGMPEEVLQALSSDKQLRLPISFEPEANAEGGVPNVPLLLPSSHERVELVDAVVVEDDAVETTAPQIESASEETVPAEEPLARDEVTAPIDEAAAPITIVSEAEVEPFIPPTDPVAEVSTPVVDAEAVAPNKKSKDRKRGKRNEPTSTVLDEAEATPAQNANASNTETEAAHIIAEEDAAKLVADETENVAIAEEPVQETPPQTETTAETNQAASDFDSASDTLILAAEEISTREEVVEDFVSNPELAPIVIAAAHEQESEISFAAIREEQIEIKPDTAFDPAPTVLAQFEEDAAAIAEEPVAPFILDHAEQESEEIVEPVLTEETPTEIVAAPQEASAATEAEVKIVEDYALDNITIVAAKEVQSEFEAPAPLVLAAPPHAEEVFPAEDVVAVHDQEATNAEPAQRLAASPLLAEQSILIAEEKAEDEIAEMDTWPEVNEVRFTSSHSSIMPSETMQFAPYDAEAQAELVAPRSAASIHIVDEDHASFAKAPAEMSAPAINERSDATETAQTVEPDFFV